MAGRLNSVHTCARTYDDRMRRVTITIPEETLERVRRSVDRGDAASVSAYLSELADRQSREDELVVLLDALDAELGAPAAEDVEWARQVTR